MASSNHAADYYEELILDKKYDVVDPDGQIFRSLAWTFQLKLDFAWCFDAWALLRTCLG